MKGISTNRYTTSSIECLKQAGCEFVFRYYSKTTRQPEKVIRPEEARAIAAAGLQLAVVYQDSSNTPGFFSRAKGEENARFAYEYAQQMKQPGGSAIYFAVDYDADPPHVRGPIKEYFQGVNDFFSQIGAGRPIYDIGIYGAGRVCRMIRADLPFVKYSWLALARKWWERDAYTTWDAKQNETKEPLCDLPAKLWQEVEAHDNFGQFTVDPTL